MLGHLTREGGPGGCSNKFAVVGKIRTGRKEGIEIIFGDGKISVFE